MRKPKTFTLLAVVLAVLVLGIVYAAINDITLQVSGNVVSTPEQSNFRVLFDGTPWTEGTGTAEVSITGDTTATMDVSGLKSVGEKMTVYFMICNFSEDITATLSVTSTNTNTEYFKVTPVLANNELQPIYGATNVAITVELIKTPIKADVTAEIEVSVVAAPSN